MRQYDLTGDLAEAYPALDGVIRRVAKSRDERQMEEELPALSSELPITIRTPEHLLVAIDSFREGLADKPNRPEAIRRLLMTALSGTARTQK